jgi:alkylation response protein AidB-like acyl-CoA dehydrogenase
LNYHQLRAGLGKADPRTRPSPLAIIKHESAGAAQKLGLIDMAIMTGEFYSVNASITLTMLGTVLGLLPILLAGTPEQAGRLLNPFLKKSGALTW